MKNNKGFAISSIIYSMLILFLGLILLILGNLANRKALFDKEKNDILSKFNQDEILCTAKSSVTNGNLAYGQYNYGDEYSCNLGDGESKTFYVLETSGNSVSLIMNMNVGEDGKGTTSGGAVTWCKSGTDNLCAADAALEYLENSTTSWKKLNKSQISLPTKDQIYKAAGNKSTDLPIWMYENLNSSLPCAYWTSTPAVDSIGAQKVDFEGLIGSDAVNIGGSRGVRPVITISKDQIKNLESSILCNAKENVTNGNLAYGQYNYGDEYTCELGDNDAKTFYVLENNDDTVSLIMNMNIDSNGKGTTSGNTVAWSEDGDNSNGPVTALEYLKNSTKSWTKLDSSQISLPSGQQIANAAGDKVWTDSNYTGTVLSSWLYENLNENDNGPRAYWTSTPYASSTAWFTTYYGELDNDNVAYDNRFGVRPVITISKSDIEN